MTFKMTPDDADPPVPASPRARSSGLAERVESAARARAPAPKGKGIVMMIVGLAVLGALIWDFTGGSAASRAVKRSGGNPSQPVAPKGPGEDPSGSARGGLLLEIKMPKGARLKVTPAAAAGLIASAPEAQRETLRRGALEALVEPAETAGPRQRLAFEAASRFVAGAGPTCTPALSKLTIRAYKALEHDRAAPAVILFLSRTPDRSSAVTVAALDEVIRAAERPLHVRLAAARARPEAGRKEAMADLLDDPTTHPALLEALTQR